MMFGLAVELTLAKIQVACTLVLSLSQNVKDGRLDLPAGPKFGHTTVEQTFFGREFVRLATEEKKSGLVIDAGAAWYGVNTLPVAERQRAITASDIDEMNLVMLYSHASDEARRYLDLKVATFPLFNLPPDSISVLGTMSVLHFIPPSKIPEAIAQTAAMLEPGGYWVLELQTPWMAALRRTEFLREYKMKLERGDRFPGYVENLGRFVQSSEGLAPVTLMSARTLIRELHAAGLNLIRFGYVPRKDYPRDLITDSVTREAAFLDPSDEPMETVGAIVQKPYLGEAQAPFPTERDESWKKWERAYFRKMLRAPR